MPPSLSNNIIPFSELKKDFSQIAAAIHQDKTERIVTKNGKAFIAIIDPATLDYYHDLEKNLQLSQILDEAEKGLYDLAKKKTFSLAEAKKRYNA